MHIAAELMKRRSFRNVLTEGLVTAVRDGAQAEEGVCANHDDRRAGKPIRKSQLFVPPLCSSSSES